jgi:hypothetical protein
MQRREVITLLAALAASTRCGAYAAAAPSEYEVKAVFLFNFSQFVSWPPAAFGTADAPMIIAVLGTDPFGHELDAVVKGEHVGAHPLEVRRYHDVSEVKDCHILFIDRSEAAQLGEIVQALRGRSILTVSDIDDATRAGVMIDLVKQSERIRLRINVAAARAGGLTISSKLLRPAEIVGPAEG